MIRLHDVTKAYGPTVAVDGLNLHVAAGELLALLGEPGSGKTTTLKMINRLIEPTRGTIQFKGEGSAPLPPVMCRRQIGYVIPGAGLFPHMTVAQNIAVVPRLLKWKPDAIAARVDELLALVNLPADMFRDRMSTDLSAGQQQRVSVARALAARPAIMLMDEPFAALDPLTRATLQEEYRRIHAKLGLTTVMVTHDVTEALLMADRIAVMHAGKLVQLGTPRELWSKPADDRVKALMHTPRRQANRLEALVKQEA